MTLITCKECELPVSDKAMICPHCGYPINEKSKNPTRKKSRYRLPNGFGQITELKGRNLRKPYRAMITVGKNDKGRPICKLLKPEAYFETYNDAYAALVEYNKNPYDIDTKISIGELYTKWSEQYFKRLNSDSSIRTIKAAWAYCRAVETLQATQLRPRHIKQCIDTAKSENIKRRIKSLFNLMLDYAVEYEIVDRNYAREFNADIEVIPKKDHVAFSDEEILKLWKNINTPLINAIIIQCYTGFRPQELVNIELKNINMTEGYIIGGMKTDAGKDRMVPLNSRIIPLIEKLKSLSEALNSKYLICDSDGSKMSYDKYYKRFMKIMNELDMDHRPHDPRKTFVTIAKNKGVDEYAIKRIIGHTIEDLTERVYTERNIDWLKEEIEKI